MPLVNFNQEPCTVSLANWADRPVLDLLSGETVDTHAIALEPMLPRLLRLRR